MPPCPSALPCRVLSFCTRRCLSGPKTVVQVKTSMLDAIRQRQHDTLTLSAVLGSTSRQIAQLLTCFSAVTVPVPSTSVLKLRVHDEPL